MAVIVVRLGDDSKDCTIHVKPRQVMVHKHPSGEYGQGIIEIGRIKRFKNSSPPRTSIISRSMRIAVQWFIELMKIVDGKPGKGVVVEGLLVKIVKLYGRIVGILNEVVINA